MTYALRVSVIAVLIWLGAILLYTSAGLLAITGKGRLLVSGTIRFVPDASIHPLVFS